MVVAWSPCGGDHCVGAVPLCRAARLAGRPKGGAPQRLCLVAPALRVFCVGFWSSRCGVELAFVVGGLRNELAGDKILGSQERAWVPAS